MINFQNIKKLPLKTGVYLFKDSSGNVLYVGKAINLKKRVKNYFRKPGGDFRINNLLNEAKKIDHVIVNSEIEALLLEAKLIKQYCPKFNVRLKDDKRYLYAGISKEKFSRVFLLRAPEKTNDLLAWFGPFPSSQSIKEILRLLRRIFPFRSCRKLPRRVCLYYHLNLCPGMCQFPVFAKEYKANIRKIKLFLEGKISFLRKKLEKEMNQLAKNLAFEQAEKCRRQIQMMENMLGKFKKIPEEERITKQLNWLRKILIKYQGIDPVVIHRLEAYDIANLGKDIVVGAMAVFVNGEPDTSEYRQFKVKIKSGGDPQALQEILERRLKHQEWLYPQLILVDGGKSQVSAVFKALKEKGLAGKIALLGLAKEEETMVIPHSGPAIGGTILRREIKGWKLIKQSAKCLGLPILQYARDEVHRFAQRYYKKLHKKSIFRVSELG